MKKYTLCLITALIALGISLNSYAQTATHTINANVATVFVVSDTTDATSNPTSTVTLTADPALSHPNATGTASFRVRTNSNAWKVTVVETGAFNAGGTQIAESDIGVAVSHTAGMSANAGTLAYANSFDSGTTLATITTTPKNVVTSTQKTASAKGAPTENYLQFTTTYTIPRDFFFESGTATKTVRYTLAAN